VHPEVVYFMEILLNDEPLVISSPHLNLLVETYCEGRTQGVAVAINQQVVPRTDWSSIVLNPNDQVLIIRATQGG